MKIACYICPLIPINSSTGNNTLFRFPRNKAQRTPTKTNLHGFPSIHRIKLLRVKGSHERRSKQPNQLRCFRPETVTGNALWEAQAGKPRQAH